MEPSARKPIRCLVVDTGPLINNQPTISTLLSLAEELITIPSVISEIKDSATRLRVETQLLPFLTLRNPLPESIKIISDFARRTGDLEVLSRPDISLLALCYEIDVERTGGAHLRRDPTQARQQKAQQAGQQAGQSHTDANAEASEKSDQRQSLLGEACDATGRTEQSISLEGLEAQRTNDTTPPTITPVTQPIPQDLGLSRHTNDSGPTIVDQIEGFTEEQAAQMSALSITDTDADIAARGEEQETGASSDSAPAEATPFTSTSDDSDSDGWITPSNLKKHQEKARLAITPSNTTAAPTDAAILTNDFAMQNVALRIGLELVSSSTLMRITKVKSWILRCHGCFSVTRQLNKQFCPRCGQPTLTRTSCSTNSKGEMTLHLKRNYTYNKRGNVYSIPKPVHGTANGKLAPGQGGGKQGWGRELILAEDQKEYGRKTDEERRTKYRDIMDQDYLPGILTGERTGGHGRIKVGAGKNVNAKKRR